MLLPPLDLLNKLSDPLLAFNPIYPLIKLFQFLQFGWQNCFTEVEFWEGGECLFDRGGEFGGMGCCESYPCCVFSSANQLSSIGTAKHLPFLC